MQLFDTIDGNDWHSLAPHYAALRDTELTPALIPDWLQRWSDLERIVWDARAWHKRARARDTRDVAARDAFQRFVETVFTPALAANQMLQTKLLAVEDWQPAPDQREFVRRMQVEASLVRSSDDAIAPAIAKLQDAYFDRVSSTTVMLDGVQMTLPQAEQRVRDPDRAVRETAWRTIQAAWTEQREVIDDLFLQLVAQRQQLARTAGLTNYRDYRWREFARLDYTPADCLALHDLIATEIMPLTRRWLETRRAELSVDVLHPWDLAVDRLGRPPTDAFATTNGLETIVERMVMRIDPEIGAVFGGMRDEFLDLGSRVGKMPGGEEWIFARSGQPYIHLNAVGTSDDVLTLLHECGHAFHDAISWTHQPLFWNLGGPSEFSEFAAITLVALALPFLERDRGGFCTPDEARRVRTTYLEEIFVKWLPLIATVDAFQHWLYAAAPADLTAADLRMKWNELAQRFMPIVDWTGLEAEQMYGWQSIRLLFSAQFYYIEYALAHLGALQVWRAALDDHAAAVQAYKTALALGGTQSLPALFAAAGAQLPFDSAVVRSIVAFVTRYFDTTMADQLD